MKNAYRNGFSLLEVLVAILIVAASIGGLAALYPGIYTGVKQDMQNLKAWGVCQKFLETKKNSNFANLLNQGTLPGQTPVAYYLRGDGQTENLVDNLTASAVYYVQKMRDKIGTDLPDILALEVVVCYKLGKKVIGEDANLNGALNAGEDVDGQTGLDSPISLRTLVYTH